MTFDTAYLETAHAHCSRNRNELQASEDCGCFYCCETFGPTEVDAWIEEAWNDGEPDAPVDKWTARCPRCDIDSVIGSASGLPVEDPSFLRAMHEYWFERIVDAAN
jgi:hypothetical protein